jgi:alkylation response protein AidB-like acyl-CoA dehydrogenase
VDFRVSSDQQALKDGVRSFCDGRCSLDTLRELEGTRGFDRSLWKDLAELGVFALRLPEERGGTDLGMAEAVLVFEELGRSLVPGPLLWSHLAAGLVEGAASGDVVVGALDLTGAACEPHLVEHWEDLDALLVLRREGVERIDPRSLSVEPVATPLDPLTPLHHAAELPPGEEIGGSDRARELRLAGTALASGQLLGIAEATLDLALDYAKKREQFGRVIGSFQALKHMLADMFARRELARAAVYAAAATLDQPEVGDVERAVSTGKLMASEAAMKNARACIQIYGGMGYTWEVPAHYYYKRIWVLQSLFGSCEEHALRMGESLDASL